MPKKAQEKTNENLSAQAEVLHLKEQLVRALADYQNLEKRTEKLSSELFLMASQRIVKRLLPVLDMLIAAQEHLKDGGLSIVVKEFEQTLFDEGYEKISPKEGEAFSADKMEAVEVCEVENKDLDNTVEKVSLVGWKQGESIARPAKVVVKKYKE